MRLATPPVAAVSMNLATPIRSQSTASDVLDYHTDTPGREKVGQDLDSACRATLVRQSRLKEVIWKLGIFEMSLALSYCEN